MGEIRGEQSNREEKLVEQPVEQEANSSEVEMPEDFEDPEGKSGKWKTVKGEVEIEGQKVEVSYREKVIELPKHRQEETGIKRIRRREIIDLPAFFGKFPDLSSEEKVNDKEFSYTGCCDFFKFITDGRFPSSYTWSHVFLGDHGARSHFSKEVLDNFVKQGLYFQKLGAVIKRGTNVYEGGTTASTGRQFYHEFEKDKSNFNLSVGLEEDEPYNPSWTDGLPMFAFGGKNGAFVDYIKSILSNDEVLRILQYTGWEVDTPLDVIDGSADINIREKALMDAYTHNRTDETFNLYKDRVKRLLDAEVDIVENVRTTSDIKNTEMLKLLIENKPLHVANWCLKGGHPFIPIVHHPDVRPLRWCHAELAIIPTKRSLNVLFFETGDEDKQEAGKSEK